MITSRRANAIAKVIQSLGRRYVQYINSTYQRSGTLWEGRYKASVVAAETYLLLGRFGGHNTDVLQGVLKIRIVSPQFSSSQVNHGGDSGDTTLISSKRTSLKICIMSPD